MSLSAAGKHILIIVDSLIGRGAEKAVVTMVRALLDQSHLVSLVLYEAVIDYEVDPRADLYYLDPIPLSKPRIFSFLSYRRNADKFRLLIENAERRRGKVDLILSHLPRSDRVVSLANLDNAYHVIHSTLSFQNSFFKKPWHRRWSRRRLYKRIYDDRNLIGVSEGVTDDFLRNMHVVPRSARTLYNPFDIAAIRARAEAPLSLPFEDYIVHAGAYTIAAKRQDLIIEAFARSGLPCKLVLLGRGKDEERIRALIQEKNLSEQVILPGFQLNPYQWMKNARFMVVGSNFEGLPTVIIESLIVGTPVVSTDCPSGPREILIDELARGLVPVGDADAMAAKFKEFYLAPPTIHPEVVQRFDASEIARQYLELCQESR